MGAGSREALYTLQAHMVLVGNSVVSEQNLHRASCVSLLLDYLGSATQLLCYCSWNNQKESHHHGEHIQMGYFSRFSPTLVDSADGEGGLGYYLLGGGRSSLPT